MVSNLFLFLVVVVVVVVIVVVVVVDLAIPHFFVFFLDSAFRCEALPRAKRTGEP